MSITHTYKGPSFSYVDASEIIACGTVFIVLNSFVVCARFYMRKRQRQAILADDWLTIPALFMIIGMNICLFYGVSQGVFGYPSPPNNIDLVTGNVSPQYRLNIMLSAPFTLMMIVAYSCIKLSTLFFYRRVFIPSWQTPFGYTCIVCIIIILCWTVGIFITYTLGCGTHFGAIWGNFLLTAEYCGRSFDVELGLFVSDFCTDLLVLVLPFYVIWSLQMTVVRKLCVTAIMLLGGMALAASITRVAIYVIIQRRGFDLTEDINLASSTILYWSSIEAGLGLLATCLPSLRQFFTDKGPLPVSRIWTRLRSTISIRPLYRRRAGSLSNDSQPPSNLKGTEMTTYGITTTLKDKWTSTSKTAILMPEQMHHDLELRSSDQYEEKRRQWRHEQFGDALGVDEHYVPDGNMV